MIYTRVNEYLKPCGLRMEPEMATALFKIYRGDELVLEVKGCETHGPSTDRAVNLFNFVKNKLNI